MAAHVEFGEVMGAGAPVYQRIPRTAEKLTTTSSAATTATAIGGEYATVTAIGADVYVLIGSNPTALASGAGMRFITAGATRDFGPLQEGDKVAAIDA